jgi:hypothetical protein
MAFTQADRMRFLAKLYSIRRNTLSQHSTLLNMAQFGGNIFPVQPPPPFGSDADEDDDSETLSEINLSIDTPIHITGDNNLVSIDPGIMASKVAMAIIGSLKQLATDGGGIPLIDENGRPRPITIAVKAATIIEGARNVVGERAVVSSMLVSEAKKKAEDAKENGSRKRERAGSEPLGADSKRLKKE